MIETFFLKSNSSAPLLRIGVMIDDAQLISPFAAVLRHIHASNFAQIELIIRNANAPVASERRRSLPLRILKVLSQPKLRAHLLYSAYSSWDTWRHPDEAKVMSKEDSSSLLANVPEIKVVPQTTRFVQRFPEEAIDAIRSHNLDVILRFGFNILRGEILTLARCGVWSFHHGDADYYRGGPALFWEIVENSSLSGATLQVLTEELDAGLILAKTLSPTQLGVSRVMNMVSPYYASEMLVIWKLHQLHELGWDAVRQTATMPDIYRGQRKIYRTPTNIEMMKFLFRKFGQGLYRRIKPDRRIREWQVGIRPKSSQSPWQGGCADYQWITAPQGHFYADPFLIERNGRTWLFIEDYIRAAKRGVLSCCEVHVDGIVGPAQVVLDRPYHLSFPFIFEESGVVYMIPETAGAGRVELYRALDFPFRWELDRVLWKGPARDTILHVGDDGTHYFFTSLRQSDKAQVQLFLFKSGGLHEPWELHPASPISLDARYARNAGAIVSVNGQLVRTSQDSTLWYGRQMHFHVIETLNPYEYRERLVGSRVADWSPEFCGMHTYGCSTQWEVIDAIKLVPKLSR